jgi:hypothetical protein
MLFIAAQILDPFWKLQSFRKLDKAMDITHKNKGSFTAQYKDAFIKYVEHKYRTRNPITTDTTHNIVPNHNIFSSIPTSGPGQSTCDTNDLPSDDK